MKQKLAIACWLLHAPKVIYFDEPLTGLDPIGIRRMKDSILSARVRERPSSSARTCCTSSSRSARIS